MLRLCSSSLQVIHKKMCRVVERLPVSQVAEMRDLIDLHSEGRGFLPLVLSGGMEHYRILASVRRNDCFGPLTSR